MANPTTNYGWALPVPDGSAGTWDDIINAAFQSVDDDLAALAAATLPLAGGTMTGQLNAEVSTAKRTDLGSVTTVVADLSAANVITATLSGNATVSAPTNVPSGTFLTPLIFVITNGGSFTLGWNAVYLWPGGTPPSPTASGVDVYAGFTVDDGTSFHMVRVSADSQ